MIKKGINIKIDLETHKWLEKIQFAELDKFGYLERRRKEDVAADVLKVGVAAFIKQHNLEIKL